MLRAHVQRLDKQTNLYTYALRTQLSCDISRMINGLLACLRAYCVDRHNDNGQQSAETSRERTTTEREIERVVILPQPPVSHSANTNPVPPSPRARIPPNYG